MEQLSVTSLIAVRPAHQRVWMVRASGGLFTETFSAASLMAIGHIDELKIKDGEIEGKDILKLDIQLRQKYPDRSRMSVTSHVNQTKRFCNDVKVGDLIVTVDAASLMIGKVTGSPYIDRKPVVVTHAFRESINMPYHLRREVSWGPKLPRRAVPLGLEMTLQAHQTVFNLDAHWEAVYHLLYPCFRSADMLYLSANIQQKKALDNYSLTQFFGILSGIEAISKTLIEGTPAAIKLDYKEMLGAYVLANDMLLTSKAEFMSPGTIWAKVKMSPKEMAIAAMLYCMLFGGDMTLVKTDGIIDKELRHKIFNLATELAKTHNFPKLERDLKVDIPKLDTKPLDGKEPAFPRTMV